MNFRGFNIALNSLVQVTSDYKVFTYLSMSMLEVYSGIFS